MNLDDRHSLTIKSRRYAAWARTQLSRLSSDFFKGKVVRVPGNLLHFRLEVDVLLLVEETPLLVYLLLVGDDLLGREALNCRNL